MMRAPSTPPQIPGYSYERLLAQGGFSDVFLYDQKFPKRKVAIKVLLVDELTDDTRRAFVDEANLMALLSAHPFIVSIFHADFAPDDRPYFVMEYCSGPSLSDRYKDAPFSVVEALQTGVRLAGAIATAHSAGILHRDIKPGNVLTNSFGPALTDFGISSALDDALPLHTTTVSQGASATGTVGTTGSQAIGLSVPWSPPEMFEEDPKPDFRSDVFSLAATIYTLLAGHTPFEIPGRSNNRNDVTGRIERGAITPFSRTDLPRSLVSVLQKAMSFERDDRYATAVEFGRALNAVEAELGYAQTTINLPSVAAPARAGGPDDAPERTTARQVTKIDAQPVVAPVAPQQSAPVFLPTAAPGSLEQTAHRDATSLAGETAMRPKTPPAAPTAEPRKGSPLKVVLAVLGALVLIAVIAVVLPLTNAFTASPPAEPGDGVSEQPIDPFLDGVPTPVLESVTSSTDGTTVTFTWSNAGGMPADTYIWTRTDGANDGLATPTEEPLAVISGVSPGAQVCIEVVVRREGRTSAVPLAECSS